MKTNKGFSLVELVVVIAIMAIIAAVAIPVYSTYVDKTNKAADEQLVADIKHALEIALVADTEHEFAGSVSIMLKPDGVAEIKSAVDDTDDIAFVTKIMKDTYGDDWSNVCKLKWGEWEGGSAADIVANYKDSSFSGNEDALIEQLGNLTGEMANFFAVPGRDIPASLKNYMDQNGVAADDATGIANSTVVVFADAFNTEGKTPDQITVINQAKSDISNALMSMTIDYQARGDGTIYTTSEKLNEAYGTIYTDPSDANMILLSTAATLYAYAEAYSQYGVANGYDGAINILHGVDFKATNGAAVLGQVIGAFNGIVAEALPGQPGEAIVASYFAPGGQAEKDAKSIFSVLDAVNNSSDVLSSDLSNPNFYKDGKIADLLNAYIAVGSLNIAEGQAAVVINPNKSVVAYLGGLKG